MPPRVARVARNSAGRPVPGVSPWNVTREGQMAVRENAQLGPHLICPCRPGRGTPAFGEQCPEAQRALMAHRRCGLCTTPIKATTRVVFVGGLADNAYMEPPLHSQCAAYALQACPVLSAAGARTGLALARTYQLRERRITGLSPTGRDHAMFDYQDPLARLAGVLDFYVAFPDGPERMDASRWLEENAPRL